MHGIGIYLRALSRTKHGTPKQAAKKAADHGVSFVALMACWQEPSKRTGNVRSRAINTKDDILRRYAEAFANHGVTPWIWGFPWGGHEERFCEIMQAQTCDTIEGWILDPELGYKWSRKPGKKTPPSAVRGTLEALDAEPDGTARARKKQASQLISISGEVLGYEPEQLGDHLCVTSYGMAQYHKNFPWKEFGGYGVGSPQFYTVGAKQIRQGLEAWRDYEWSSLVPSVPAFGKNDGDQMHSYLSNFVDVPVPVRGFIFWSWRQLSSKRDSAGNGFNEWDILHRWSQWIGEGLVCIGDSGSV